MSDINVNQLLSQMRTLSAQTQAFDFDVPLAKSDTNPAPQGAGFGDLLKQTIDDVNKTQSHASKVAADFERGVNDTDLADVMVSLQKSSLSFTAMTEVRNKLVNAYQEIMNMPV